MVLFGCEMPITPPHGGVKGLRDAVECQTERRKAFSVEVVNVTRKAMATVLSYSQIVTDQTLTNSQVAGNRATGPLGCKSQF